MSDPFNIDDEPEDEGFGLVMPFLPVASKGGPLDDEAYVAGFEVGRLDAILATAETLGLTPDTHYLIHELNAEQLDLIAMRYGFTCTVEPIGEGWARATVTRIIPTDSNEGES